MGLLVFHLPKLPFPVESLSESVFEVPAHREIRIDSAKRLLSGTNHFLVRIAAMAGFSSSTILSGLSLVHGTHARPLSRGPRRKSQSQLGQGKKVNPGTSWSIPADPPA